MIESAAFTLNTRSVEITFLSLFLFPFLLLGQRTQPYFHNFTTKDGLPSSETYCAVQDREGYMWIGTDNGVARFDGYEFEVFGPEDGLEDGVVFNIVMDSTGMLWFGTFSGRVFSFRNNRFHPHPANQKLVSLRQKAIRSISLIDVQQKGDLIIKIDQNGLVKVSYDGAITNIINSLGKSEIRIWESSERKNPIWGTRKRKTSKYHGDTIPIYRHHNSRWELIAMLDNEELNPKQHDINISIEPYAVYQKEGKEVLIMFDSELYYTIQPNQYTRQKFGLLNTNYSIPHHKKGFWIATARNGGLYHCYLEQDSIILDKVLLDASLNHITYDRKGGLWVCSQGNGIFYSINPDIANYTWFKEQRQLVPLAIQIRSPNTYLASYDDVSLIEHDSNKKIRFRYDNVSSYLLSSAVLVYDSISQRTFMNQGILNHELHDNNFISYKISDREVSFLRFLKKDPQNETNKSYAVINKKLYEVDLSNWEKSLRPILIKKTDSIELTAYMREPSGHQLIGSISGLFTIDKNHKLTNAYKNTPQLKDRISDINLLQNNTPIVSTRGNGLIILDNEKDPLTVDVEDGLPSNQIRGIHKANDGTIWLETFSGLGELHFDTLSQLKKSRVYTVKHGLPSNEIHDITNYGSEIWLATGGGVVKFKDIPWQNESIIPTIRSVIVDGQVLPPDSIQLSPGQKDVKINFNTINYQMLGDINYRYRIKPNEKWQYTKNRTIEYPNLNAGQYRFEVQSQNRDGVWSESKILTFSIPPLWHQTWWATVLGIIGLIGLIAGIFYIREVRRRKEQALKEQLESLERSAIQAQMNPHFVFNSLNSIQYFILENNTKQAVYYLARFASLIRQTLRASIRGVHTLRDEIDMLKIYLSLEKLRFKEIFEYQVIVSDQLAIDDLLVRPMLVQPFVENAILHGVSSLDAGGQITLKFSGNNQKIVVEVIDNGKGFDPEKINHQDSMGLNITRNRLAKDHPVSHNGTESLIIESILNSRGEVAGTKIQLILMPQSPKTQMHV